MVDIGTREKISILEQSEVLFENKVLSLDEVRHEKNFKPQTQPYINADVSKKSVWIKFQLKNSTPSFQHRVLVFNSPLLESIELYRGEETQPELRGLSWNQPEHRTIAYYYDISLAPKSEMIYYVKVHSQYTPLSFSVTLEDKNSFLKVDGIKQFKNILLLGILVALMLHALGLTFYEKDKSYFYYALYLFFMIYQQLTYVGLTQIYLPYDFIDLDIQWTVFKVSMLMFTSALFAMHFLKTKNIPWLHRIYKWFLVFILLEMLIFSLSLFYNLQVIILTGALFIVFNLMAGIITYKKGHKEARLFIVGFGTVFVAYFLMIIDALGLVFVIQYVPNLLMWTSAIEALLLSLAFSDRYTFLVEEKEKTDRQLLESYQNREKIIIKEVKNKTAQLNQALKTKELLLKEVHHRIKNNLQIILSMVRLQNDKSSDKATIEKFVNLENRINAIAKTYNLLLPEDDLNAIDMDEYVESLLQDIQASMDEVHHEIEIETDIDAMIPLRESVYIGIIINELVTNAYKHAFEGDKGRIAISMHQEKEEYVLMVGDNGKGFIDNKESKSLGLKLIHALVYEQLKGDIEMKTHGLTEYIIRFSL